MDYKDIAKKIRTDLGRAKAEDNNKDDKLSDAMKEYEKLKSLPVSQLEALLADTISAPAREYSEIYNGVNYGEELRQALILELKWRIHQARERESQPKQG